MEEKKNVKSLEEIAKRAKLEFIDDGPDEPRSGTPESPETLIPEAPAANSSLFQFKQNFGLSLMGLIMIGVNLNRLSRELSRPVYYHITVLTLIALSLFVEVVIVTCALIMSSYNIHKSGNLLIASRFNNLLLYSLFFLIISQVGLISFDIISTTGQADQVQKTVNVYHQVFK